MSDKQLSRSPIPSSLDERGHDPSKDLTELEKLLPLPKVVGDDKPRVLAKKPGRTKASQDRIEFPNLWDLFGEEK